MNYDINYLNYNSPLNEKVIEFQELLRQPIAYDVNPEQPIAKVKTEPRNESQQSQQ